MTTTQLAVLGIRDEEISPVISLKPNTVFHPTTSASYRIVKNTRFGRSLVATRAIAANEIILSESPLVESKPRDDAYTIANYGGRTVWSAVEVCLQQCQSMGLSLEQYSARHRLDEYSTSAYHFVDRHRTTNITWDDAARRVLARFADKYRAIATEDQVYHLYTIMGVNLVTSKLRPFDTPTFYAENDDNVGVPVGTPALACDRDGLFPILSCCNHSCDPNAQILTPSEENSMNELVALCPIAKGEHIAYNYLGPRTPKSRQVVWESLNFVCRCNKCEGLCVNLTCSNRDHLKLCPCRNARYCSTGCHRADWRRHKHHEHHEHKDTDERSE